MSCAVPAAVHDSETLHRVVDAGNIKDGKPHYMAFYSSTLPSRISVDRAEFRTAADSLAGEAADARLAALIAQHARELKVEPQLRVESCPEHGNDAHAEIIASETHSKKFIKTKVCAMLADIARLV